MKPAPFDYYAPESLEEAIALMGEHGDDAKVLAGGQSLVPMTNFRLVRPAVMVDLNRVNALGQMSQDGQSVAIGAMVRHRAVETLAGLTARCPMIGEALGLVGHIAVRNRGTVGGSVAHADPAAEWAALLLALDGTCEIRSVRGARTVDADDFFVDYMTTCLEPDEILTRVSITPPVDGGSAFTEVARRHGDFAQAGVAAWVSLDAQGAVADARIALIGVGTTAVRAVPAEQILVGQRPSDEVLAEVAGAVGEHISPFDDVHATAEYKQRLAEALTRRTVALAFERARSEVVA